MSNEAEAQIQILLNTIGRSGLVARVLQEVERYKLPLLEVRDIGLYKKTCFIQVGQATIAFDLEENNEYISARTTLQTKDAFALQEDSTP